MGESTKRGKLGAGEALDIDDTLAAEAAREPIPVQPTQAVTSLPAAERYRLGRELGRGGMGRVVEALDLQLGRIVAYKEVLPRGGTSIAKRFAREVQLTARLEHPSIVPLYDSGTTADGRPFYVMRRVSGRPLDQLMAKAAHLSERLTLLPAVLAAIDAVAHAHRRGVIHRDLKPANILVGDLGETVVIDWGLAKVIGEDDDAPGQLLAQASDSLRTQIGSVFGTPGFMAPEQARGEALDPRGDVYALGAILYQLLAGAPPHAGHSATEVIEKTGSREVTPVDVVAPGAPNDLVAIVGKALAFHADQRYPNARALGEDVRRFLSGQLVAAHHYTPRQHIARFARRHRAPLSVAALAMVTVAVMAWIGVHRIVTERDAAERAHVEAVEQRDEANRARAEAQAHADQLLISNARALLEHNPTHAAAVLKKIPEASERAADARAVAQAAIVRGTAWTMQLTDDLTVYGELSPDAKFWAQVTRDGVIRVWDLDRKKLVTMRKFADDAHATWAGRALFVTSGKQPAALFDPFAGTTQAPPVGTARWAVATERGDRIAYIDGDHAAHVLDVATRAITPLWPGHAVDELEMAFDGAWIAMSDKAMVEVVDPGGRELTSHPGPAVRLVGSRFGALAVQSLDDVAVCVLGDKPAWTTIDFKPFGSRPLEAEFRGRELVAFVPLGGKLIAWDGTRTYERARLGGFSFRMVTAGGDLLVVPGTDAKLHFLNDRVTGALDLPMPLEHFKVFARPGAPRVVAVGDGVLVGFDLQDLLPEPVAMPPNARATFVDDTTLLIWSPSPGDWSWYDVRTRASTALPYDAHGLPEVIDADPSDGRVLVRELGNDTALYLIRKGARERRPLVHGKAVWGRLMPHDGLIFGVGDGRVFAAQEVTRANDPGAPAPREVVKLDGAAETAVGFGDAGYAAISTSGEVVRGDYLTGALSRAHVAPGETGAIAADHAGHVILAVDDRLLAWGRDVVELGKLDQRIQRIVASDAGAVVELADHSVVLAPLVPGAPAQRLVGQSDQAPLISAGGKLVIGRGVNNQLVAVEVDANGRASPWTLPVYFDSIGLASISPTSRRFVQTGFGWVALWTLPLAPPGLRAWLDERTNALSDRNDALAWPWQAMGAVGARSAGTAAP
ncbi:MAG TPA: serine/threonine-protein kinase [Kofleriaceae bacterium]|nr:serine/threonine-protein kinase [Kofleriaceae bacterium]